LPLGVQGFRFQRFIGVTSSVVIAGLDPAIHLCFAWRGIVGAVRDRVGQTMMCREPQ
jgi:hypothetical protein